MREKLLAFGLICIALGACGCIVIHHEEVVCREERAEPKDATIEEIDAVSKLAFNTDRSERYKQIAQREGLIESVQVHLIESVFEHLVFNTEKVDVLLVLVHNPGFAPGSRSFLLDQLDRLAFDQDKQAILDALND